MYDKSASSFLGEGEEAGMEKADVTSQLSTSVTVYLPPTSQENIVEIALWVSLHIKHFWLSARAEPTLLQKVNTTEFIQ